MNQQTNEQNDKNYKFPDGVEGGNDGRTDEQAQTNFPLQLLRSWGHNNA